MLQANDRLRGALPVRDRLKIHEAPRPAGRTFRAQHESLDVAVEQLLLLVGEGLELLEDAIELSLIELEAERLDPLAEGVTAAVLAEHEMAARQADVLRAQDFVRRMVFQHAVLVNAGLVREGVLAHDRLVARDRHAGDARNQPRGRIEAVGLDVRW